MTTAPLPASGYHAELDWASPVAAARIARDLTRPAGRTGGVAGTPMVADICRCPHRTMAWAFAALTAGPVLAAVQAVIGPRVAILEPTFPLCERPGGFVVPPHQDGVSGGFVLDARRAVAVWFAVTDADPANGCLQVVPGSSDGGHLPHRRGADEGGRGAPLALTAPPPEAAFVPVPVTAGRAVVMDVRIIHRSAANTTHTARIGLNVCYTAPGAVRPPPRRRRRRAAATPPDRGLAAPLTCPVRQPIGEQRHDPHDVRGPRTGRDPDPDPGRRGRRRRPPR